MLRRLFVKYLGIYNYMKLSIIIPVFNRPQQVAKAVRSVLSQNFNSFELIIVDDGSLQPLQLPDDLSSDNRINILRHETNKGAGAARNSGIVQAVGKYVAFLDSDDLWCDGKLRAQMKAAEKLELDEHHIPTAIVTGFRLKSAITSKDSILQPVPSKLLSDFVSGCWFCPGSTLLINRKVYEIVGGYDERLRRLEDVDWFIRFGGVGGSLHVVGGMYVDIMAGAKASSDVVSVSSKYLLEKYSQKIKPDLHLQSSNLRLLRSYLALEIASSNAAHKEFLRMFINLARSFLLKPRVQLQLKNWWD